MQSASRSGSASRAVATRYRRVESYAVALLEAGDATADGRHDAKPGGGERHQFISSEPGACGGLGRMMVTACTVPRPLAAFTGQWLPPPLPAEAQAPRFVPLGVMSDPRRNRAAFALDYLGVFDDVAKALEFDEKGFRQVVTNIAG